jgi:hypothetical protein
LLTLGFTDHISSLLEEAGIGSVGDLIFQMKLDPSEIREISGIGPKTMQDIEDAIELLIQSIPDTEEEPRQVEEAVESAEAPSPEAVEAEAEEVEADLQPGEAEEALEPEAIEEEIEAAEQEEEAVEAEIEEEAAEEEEEEEPASMEEIFELKPEMLDSFEDAEPEELESQEEKGKKRKKYVEVEYDPEHDVTIYRKRHKRGSKDWEKWEGELDEDDLDI